MHPYQQAIHVMQTVQQAAQTLALANNVPDRHGSNLYTDDVYLKPLLALYLPADVHAHIQPWLHRMGELAGGKLDEWALTADKNPPTLEHRSRTGEARQRIIKHPAYVQMERIAFGEFGLALMSHRDLVLAWPDKLPPLVKYALTYLFVQAEFGLCCPLSMTDSLARTLRKFGDKALVEKYWPQLTSLDFSEQAQGAMFMTEQAAGSDIANTQTIARQEPDGTWRLYGDKWFCSNPDADLAMVLARTGEMAAGHKGVSLFLLPRKLDDGSDNHYHIVRLKEKLGSRSMASGEIVLQGAVAYLVGEQGRGFVQIADMVNNSRLSNGMRAAGLMRRAVTEAGHVARSRQAFGKPLIEMPLMQRQLEKMAIRCEQARTMMFQTAQALERADGGDKTAYALLRILTPLIKFRACRDARQVTGDAMEVRGGCGYIEEWSDARLVRDAHLGSIWEGTSNIVALDVLRAIRREGALPVLQAHAKNLLAQAAKNPAVTPAFCATLTTCLEKASALATYATSESSGECEARAAASGLYHSFSAIAMTWEAAQLMSASGTPESEQSIHDLQLHLVGVQRLYWAQEVLLHRVLPRDPLLHDDPERHAEWIYQPDTTPSI